MALRKIVTKEDNILRKKSRSVESFDERLFQLLDDMAETMYAAEGVGLAAVQVAVLRRAAVIDIGEGKIELINPVIISREGEQVETEGCLSLPGEWYETVRPMRVKVRAQDRHGNWCEYEGEELLARCFCHEIDHLDGILFIDRLKRDEEEPELSDETTCETSDETASEKAQPSGNSPAETQSETRGAAL